MTVMFDETPYPYLLSHDGDGLGIGGDVLSMREDLERATLVSVTAFSGERVSLTCRYHNF